MSGTFIVIDGTDGSGKGTQTTRLFDRLKSEGRDVLLVDFPRYGKPSAYFVERYLRGEYGELKNIDAYRASTFYALDRFDASFEIRAALDRGAIVISNRYVSANKGHQMGKIKDPEERKKFLDWLNGFEYGILGIPKPDLTILLHVPADIGFDLIAKKDERAYLNGKVRDIHEGDREHLRAAEDAYLSLAALDTVENWKLLQCVQDGRLLSIEEVQERVWDTVSHLFTPSSTP
nr:Thymidylate kinase [uncultured bacterium]AIA16241.1 Thymidylate kinase [uncultured bacterium]